MAFLEVRSRVVEHLRAGSYSHWPRKDFYLKNWLGAGRIGETRMISLLLRCGGHQHRESPHDFDREVTVHEFLPQDGGDQWYIKVFVDEDLGEAVFMSVHPAGT